MGAPSTYTGTAECMYSLNLRKFCTVQVIGKKKKKEERNSPSSVAQCMSSPAC